MSRLFKKNSDGKIEDIFVVHAPSNQSDLLAKRYLTPPNDAANYKHPYLVSDFHNTNDPCLTVYGDYTYDDLTSYKPWSQYSTELKNFVPSGFFNTSKREYKRTGADILVNSNSNWWVEPNSYHQFMDESWEVFDDLSKRYRNSYRDDNRISFYPIYETANRSFDGLLRPNSCNVDINNDFPLFRQYIYNLQKNDNTKVSFNTNIHAANTTGGVIQNPTWLHSAGSDNDTRYYNGLHVPYSSSKMKFGFEVILTADELDDYVWRRDEDKWEYTNTSVNFYGPWNWIGMITKGIGTADETPGYKESGDGYIKFYDLKKARKIAKDTYYLRDDDYYLFKNGTAADISNMFVGLMNPEMDVRNYSGPYIGITRTLYPARTKTYLTNFSTSQGVIQYENCSWDSNDYSAWVFSEEDAVKYCGQLNAQAGGGSLDFEVDYDINKNNGTHTRPMFDVKDNPKIHILAMNWFFRPVND